MPRATVAPSTTWKKPCLKQKYTSIVRDRPASLTSTRESWCVSVWPQSRQTCAGTVRAAGVGSAPCARRPALRSMLPMPRPRLALLRCSSASLFVTRARHRCTVWRLTAIRRTRRRLENAKAPPLHRLDEWRRLDAGAAQESTLTISEIGAKRPSCVFCCLSPSVGVSVIERTAGSWNSILRN